MPTQVTNNTSNPTNVAANGLPDTRAIIELDPWEIADLLISKRGEQFVSCEFATDEEFDQFVQFNSVPLKEDSIRGWSFDDRCRLINHVLGDGGMLVFVDGTILPEKS